MSTSKSLLLAFLPILLTLTACAPPPPPTPAPEVRSSPILSEKSIRPAIPPDAAIDTFHDLLALGDAAAITRWTLARNPWADVSKGQAALLQIAQSPADRPAALRGLTAIHQKLFAGNWPLELSPDDYGPQTLPEFHTALLSNFAARAAANPDLKATYLALRPATDPPLSRWLRMAQKHHLLP